ncbi:MAG TPA: glycoside hydrolase family 43 protein [Rhodothermales bacterium]
MNDPRPTTNNPRPTIHDNRSTVHGLPSTMPRSVVLAALAVLLASCTGVTPIPAASPDPQFDWFEYAGNDPVYEALDPREDQYLNPILAGFYPDPSITRAGDDYYLVTSTFSWYPGIPIFHSRDLVHWEQIGHVLDRSSQLNLDSLEISEGVFAPTINFHEGTFYVLNTLVGAGGNFIVTAKDPAGPWSDPIWLPSVDGIDPSIFFDDDGRAWIVNNGPPVGPPRYDGHRALWIQEFDLDTRQMVGPRTMIVDGGVDITQNPIWIEGPHIFRESGHYYLIAAEGGTAEWHSEVVFRADSVLGPWVPYEGNPILTQRHLPADRAFPVTSTGHADFVKTPDGAWWAVFLGTRPYRDNHYNTGRETFMLPVTWHNDWPTILPVTEPVAFMVDGPALPRSPEPAIPTSGNFTVRDEFDGAELPLYWNFIRTPRESWHDLEAGRLVLRARPVRLSDRGQPSFVGRRQQHAYFTARTKMRYRPADVSDRAGLAAFQNDDFYYFMAVGLGEGGPLISLEKRTRATGSEIVASQPVDLPEDGTIYLQIEGRGDTYAFRYSLDGSSWTPLVEDADGTILSTRTAGGFVGTYIGMHAEN